MGKYGEAAVQAVLFAREGLELPQAWARATQEVFPGKIASQKKACPKGTFLGLCEDGYVAGVRSGDYTRSADNKGYAIEAVRLLRSNPALADRGQTVLWEQVMKGRDKVPNSQMDVVLTLWERGLIVR